MSLIQSCGCSQHFEDFLDDPGEPFILPRQDPDKCYRFKQRSWLWELIGGATGKVWNAISGFFNSGGKGSGGSGGVLSSGAGSGGNFGGFSGGTSSFGFGGNGGNFGTGTGSGPGGGYNINLATIFSEFELKKIQKAAGWINNQYGFNLNTLDLYLLMDLDCIWALSDFLQNPGVPTIGDEAGLPECVMAQLISMILDMFPYLTEGDAVEIEYLLFNHYDRQQLKFYAAESESRTQRLKAYIEMKNSNSSYKVDRFIELWNLTDEDPYLLVRDCVEESEDYEISWWSDLASFTPSSTIKNIIANKGYSLQLINEASAIRVNLDYFAIEIVQMPKNPNGTIMSNLDLLRHFRLNINNYSNHGVSPSYFEPIVEDYSIWSSNNPLGSIIEIDIPANDGAVALTEYQEGGGWIFSTVRDNNTGGLSFHPVSGNREFGLVETNGSKYFYIKGADRFEKWFMNLTYPNFDPYAFSDELWNTTTNRFEDFINNNEGQATKLPAIKFRPYWDIIKSKLMSSSTFVIPECNP